MEKPTDDDDIERLKQLFTEFVAHRLADQHSGRVMIESPLRLKVEVDNQPGFQIGLWNIWCQAMAGPDSCEALVDRWIDSTFSASFEAYAGFQPEDFDRLLPVVRSLSLRDQCHANDKPILCHPLAADVGVYWVIDRQAGFQYLFRNHLKAYGLTLKGLQERAIDNLERQLETISLQDCDDYYQLDWEDYAASTLVVEALWHSLAEWVGSDLVVAVPNRSTVLLCSIRSAGGIHALRHCAAEANSAAYAISAQLLYWRAGRWQTWLDS